MVKSIIKKWKTYHTTQTLPRSGHPSKLSSRVSRKLVWDVTVNPTMTLKDLQDFMSEIGVSIHQSTRSLLSSMMVAASCHRADCHQQGTGKLVRIEGTMDGAKFRRILDENLLESAMNLKLGSTKLKPHWSV